MDVPGRWARGAICLAVACSGTVRDPTRLETAIASDLEARLGVGVVTRCGYAIPMCSATLPDGTVLPIEVTIHADSYEWRVHGLLVNTAAIEAYLRDELADLEVPQSARCLPHVRALAAGERISCALGNGGTAFVTVRSDGSTAVELALTPAAAAARSDVLTPVRERALEAASRKLAETPDVANDNDDSDDVPDDGRSDEKFEPR